MSSAEGAFAEFVKKFYKDVFGAVHKDLARLDAPGANDYASLEKLFAFNKNGHRFVKRLVQNLRVASEDTKQIIEEALEAFVRDIENHIEAFANSKGVFVLVAILECSEFREKLVSIIRRHADAIHRMRENKGLAILKQLAFN